MRRCAPGMLQSGPQHAALQPAPWLRTLCLLLFAAVATLATGTAARAQATTSGVQTDTALDLYRFRLLQTGRRVGRFPVDAIEQRLEGTAVMDLHVGMDGTFKTGRGGQSSGHPLLDQAALDMLSRAVPATEIPAALANKAFIVRVAVAFVLPE